MTLQLWERRIMVARVLDVEAAKQRISYFYLNPARADLVDTIAEYPGVSSWSAFNEAAPAVTASHSESVPWIRLNEIQKLPSRSLSRRQDLHITQSLIETAKKSYDLIVYPNAWLKAFGVTAEDKIREINQQIKKRVSDAEHEYALARARLGKKVLGASRLREEPILKSHTPKKKERRIFVLSSIAELRIGFINSFNALCDRCSELFLRFCRGEQVAWPPGVFAPACPPLANALG